MLVLGGVNVGGFLCADLLIHSSSKSGFSQQNKGDFMLRERENQGCDTNLYQVRKAAPVQDKEFTEGS